MSDLKNKEDIYKRAKLGEPIGFGTRPALLVVDYQSGFTHDFPMGGDMTDAVLKSRELIDYCRTKNIKVFFSRQGYNPDGSDLVTWALKAPGLREYTRDREDLYEIDPRLGVQEGDIVFEKHGPSCFNGTHLINMLIAMHIDTIILCGCTVGGCLYATTIDACQFGFRPMVVTDCSDDRSEETKKMFMWNMGQKYADLYSLEDIKKEIDKIEPMEYTMLY